MKNTVDPAATETVWSGERNKLWLRQMTRNNLREHLSWLLNSKPSIPPATTTLPTVSTNLTPADPISSGPEEVADSGIVQQARENIDTDPCAAGVQQKVPMAKLRTTPSSATTNRKVAPKDVRIPFVGLSQNVADREPHLLSAQPGENGPWRKPASPPKPGHEASRDVEIMDMTEGSRHNASQSSPREPKMTSGRKRKSSELDADRFLSRGGGQEGTIPSSARNISSTSQQHFAAIDEIMVEPNEPPPPYSTIAPRPAVILQPQHQWQRTRGNDNRTLSDSEDDGEEEYASPSNTARERDAAMSPSNKRRLLSKGSPSKGLLDHKGKSILTVKPSDGFPDQRQEISNSPRHSSKIGGFQEVAGPSAPPQSPQPNTEASDEDAKLLKEFFAQQQSLIRGCIDDMEFKRDDLCEKLALCMDEDRETDAAILQHELDDNDERAQSLQTLLSRRAEYIQLCAEKEQLFAALKSALRNRQPTGAVKAANSAGKEKLSRFEKDCYHLLDRCRHDVENILDSTRSKAISHTQKQLVAQAPAAEHVMRQPTIPSSAKILQTQCAERDTSKDHTYRHPDLNASTAEVSSTNISTHIPPSKRQTSDRAPSYDDPALRVRASSTLLHPIVHEQHSYEDFDDIHDDEMLEANKRLFSNRMGTPPAPFQERDDEDDFGCENDVDMLELAEHIEVHGTQQERPFSINKRPILAETSGNQSISSANVATQRAKKVARQEDSEDYEKKFRFEWSQDVKVTLKQKFRLQGFRHGQLDAINATLAGKDAFVLMPTGGGKSLCYQLPSQIKSGKTRGVTIVISPLLSLMEDQVQHLRKLNIQAFLLNGETTKEERGGVQSAMQEHDVEAFITLLYITPEMLSKSQKISNCFDALYRRQRLARLVIDEAHCVSQWGHDFRPDYKTIGDVRRRFPGVPVMALTATATENVKVDTIHNLSMDGCEVFSRSFNRPNLYYEVREKGKGKECVDGIAKIIQEKHLRQTGIIYCLSRKNCEDMAGVLMKQHNINAQYYHAGMKPEAKAEVQKKWQEGKYHVIVATIAFGMGIDKANVRFVIHQSLPKSLEGYYQETGRAGRDSKKSSCYLFYGYQDAGKLRRMITDGEGSWEQKDRQFQMLQKMVQYCENRADCRRAQVLGYFGEKFERQDCNGQCDTCNSASTFEVVDFTDYARSAIAIVRQVMSAKVTTLYCIDIFRGNASKKVKSNAHHQLKEFGVGSELDRGDIERLFSRLLGENVLQEENVVNKAGFAHQYISIGNQNRCRAYESGKKELQLQIRSTPRAKSKTVASKQDLDSDGGPVRKKRQKAVSIRSEMPLSTNISSPIHAASTRKKTRTRPQKDTDWDGIVGDGFELPEPSARRLVDTDEDYSSDGFEPIREAGRQRKGKAKVLGPPITGDALLENLGDIHLEIVEQFVAAAKKISDQIAHTSLLRSPPFTDTVLRQMAIRFTETEDQMLKIPGISQEKVQRHGKQFCKLVKQYHDSYNEMMGNNDEEIIDPNTANVINLVSDDDDDDDDDDAYGTLDESDFDGESQPTESSAYFDSSNKVQSLNSQFAHSRSAAMRSNAAPPPGQERPQKVKKARSYRAIGSTGHAPRRSNENNQRRPSNKYSAKVKGTKNTSSHRTGGRGGGRGGGGNGTSARNAAQNGFISMMPT